MKYHVSYDSITKCWDVYETDPPSVLQHWLLDTVDPFLANDIARLLAKDRNGTYEPIAAEKLTEETK